ncbi:MAG: helix-turn-helix transcriptional regulator [Myxococcota bacterium]|nr:helix-turn-helix transcriptional regulator [Myxococcota bacterium]
MAKGVSDLFGGAAVSLVIQTPGLNLDAAEFRVGLSEDSSQVARAHSSGGREWAQAVGSDLGKRFLFLGDYIPFEDMKGSEWDQEYLTPQGLAPEPPYVHVTSPEEAVLSSGLVIHRKKEGPPITDEMLGVADRLVPHLRRAVSLYGDLRNKQQQQVALHEIIDRIPTGVVILDTAMHPIITNRMAARIADEKDGFDYDESGPRGCNSQSTSQLRELIGTAINPALGRELAGGGFMALPRPSGRRSYPVLVTPVLGRTQGGTVADAAAVIFVSDPEFRDVTLTAVLTTVYGLTPAEAELAQLLAEGLSLEDAANRRHVTLNTARSQLKQVFAKTSTRRQGELLKLVLSGVATIEKEPLENDESS